MKPLYSTTAVLPVAIGTEILPNGRDLKFLEVKLASGRQQRSVYISSPLYKRWPTAAVYVGVFLPCNDGNGVSSSWIRELSETVSDVAMLAKYAYLHDSSCLQPAAGEYGSSIDVSRVGKCAERETPRVFVQLEMSR